MMMTMKTDAEKRPKKPGTTIILTGKSIRLLRSLRERMDFLAVTARLASDAIASSATTPESKILAAVELRREVEAEVRIEADRLVGMIEAALKAAGRAAKAKTTTRKRRAREV